MFVIRIIQINVVNKNLWKKQLSSQSELPHDTNLTLASINRTLKVENARLNLMLFTLAPVLFKNS